jgi:hypothetical protein
MALSIRSTIPHSRTSLSLLNEQQPEESPESTKSRLLRTSSSFQQLYQMALSIKSAILQRRIIGTFLGD